jgi:hypothetical protein
MVEYKLIRSRRRSLCVEIRCGEVIVRAPLFVGRVDIERFLRTKSGWIESKLGESKPKQEKFYLEDEAFLFFGKAFSLKIIEGLEKSIKLQGDRLVINTRATDPKYLRKLIENFYIKLTREAVEKLLAKYAGLFDFSHYKIVVKSYRSKWGSCSRHSLCFNARLAMAPPEVIEYVVIHELAHLNIKNHSRRFWQEVERHDMRYKIHRKWLRKNNQHFEL